ncbi:MAG TPA: hypothetical protein EYP30_04955, partial [Archaeoglobaceae archaeon]|nr:hypothetical protein [Archaeoglobaceae archaeon]
MNCRKDTVEFDINSELVFVFAFTFFLFFRFLNPDMFGSEQLMDAAFIKSILKAENFPPVDPFFAGGFIDFYYYFGHVLAAGITLMSSQNLEVGFNIAIATISAFSVMIAYGFLHEVLKDNKKAFAGTLFILFSGNLYSIYDFFRYILSFQLPVKDYYWDSSRVIEGTINEFPYFSFIHADYHAHFVAIPIKLIYIALLYKLFKGERIAGLMLIPLTFIIFATNSWDFPLVILLLIFVILVKLRKEKIQYTDILIILIPIIAVAAFSSTMNLQAARFIIATERTDLIQFLSFFSIQLLFAYFYFANEMRDRYSLFSILSGLAAFYFIPIAAIILPLMLISFRRAVRGDFFSILIFSSSIIVILPEIIIIGTKLNTVFKFYLTAWIYITTAGSIVLARAIEKPRSVFNAVSILLFTLTLIYPTVGTVVRHDKAEMTLDGLNFIKEMSEGDYKAIEWLKDKEGVILEVAIKDWGYGGRFAAFTGNPTVIAWPLHELQWRGTPEEIGKRMAVVRAIYTTENCTLISELLKKYNCIVPKNLTLKTLNQLMGYGRLTERK